MLNRYCHAAAAAVIALACLRAQDTVKLKIVENAKTALAVTEFRGSGEAQKYADGFNQTVWEDLARSGICNLVPRAMYPVTVPQQPADFMQTPSRLLEWSRPPVSANYLAFGYAAIQDGSLLAYGWMYDTTAQGAQNGEALARRYIAKPDAAGAEKAGHEFAADIIRALGGQPSYGTHIYFTSDRTGYKEIWVMDADGSNQKQVTNFKAIANFAAVSPDGDKIAFTLWPALTGQEPRIAVYSTDPVRKLSFYNQNSPLNGTPSFTPDGKQIVYISSIGAARSVFIADANGANPRRLTFVDSIDAEPKVNPATGRELAFTSDRTGPRQIYVQNMDGSDLRRLTEGTGEAVNPSWSPNGQMMAFAWNRGYAGGKRNIFSMSASGGEYKQLTHDEGINENPSWDPGGSQMVFASDRTGSPQIWTMLADGTQLRQLTKTGRNTNPVWGK
jgi:TolB protein